MSDFGLARGADFNLEGGKFPIKWTAPEAIKQGVCWVLKIKKHTKVILAQFDACYKFRRIKVTMQFGGFLVDFGKEGLCQGFVHHLTVLSQKLCEVFKNHTIFTMLITVTCTKFLGLWSGLQCKLPKPNQIECVE